MTKLPPPPVGTVECIIVGQNFGVPWINTFWMDSATSATPNRTQMDSLATSLLGTFQAQFRPMMTTNLSIDTCEVAYQVAADSVIPGLATNSLAGTRTGDATPASICGVVNWHTDFDHYRGGHARSYIPGPATDDVSPTHLGSIYAGALVTKAAAWRTGVNAYTGTPFTSLTLSRLARIRDKQPLDPPVLRPIVGATVRTVIGTQRRRLT